MILNNATDIRIGSTQASKVYMGSVQVWPQLQPPDEVEYSFYPTSGWNNTIADGDHLSLSGIVYFMGYSPNDGNITGRYTWTWTGDLTIVNTETDPDNPGRGILRYDIRFGSGSSQLVISDPANSSRVLFSATFN